MSKPAKIEMSFNYPCARRDETIKNIYFGNIIKDPYRWLEDLASNETKQFIESQNEITMAYIDQCRYKTLIYESIKNLWDYPKFSCPRREGNRYMIYINSGMQNQSILYKLESLDTEPEVFIDPNTLSDDGTVAISQAAYSVDGSIFAYGLSTNGSDWIQIKFKNVDTGYDYPEVLSKVKFTSIAWTHDNKGVFYSCYPLQLERIGGSKTTKLEFQKLYYHLLGTEQKDDILAVEFQTEPQYRITAELSHCGRYLIVYTMKGCLDKLIYFCDLESVEYKIMGELPLTQVVFELTNDYSYVTNQCRKALFLTNRNAPNYKLIELDFEEPHEDNWETIIEADPIAVIDWIVGVNTDKLIVCYMRHVKNILQYRDNRGHILYNFPLDIGTISGYSGREKYSEFFFQFTNFLTPGDIYKCDLTAEAPEPELICEMTPKNFDKNMYTTEQIFYTSKDKIKIPMHIIHRKDFVKNGESPCLLYGYGGFNISIQPVFSCSRLVFIHKFNGVVAIPNIRGGGEYGENWHAGGQYANKQNVFDDFQSAAEYLIVQNYTKASLLTIHGGSNGGLLVGACINQRPELYGAAICQVGIMDMLRFQKFTIGEAWTFEYGCSEKESNFKYLIKYSPLHNIRVPPGHIQYPATLLLTADHDDRVAPLHSLKFIAELQHTMSEERKQTKPLMIHIEKKDGHGWRTPTQKLLEEFTRIYAFIVHSLNLEISNG